MAPRLVGGGRDGIWVDASTLNAFSTRAGNSSQNTRELISVALANQFLYLPCKPWIFIVGGNHRSNSVAKLCLKFCLCCYEAFDCALWGVKLKPMFYHYLKHQQKVVLGEKQKIYVPWEISLCLIGTGCWGFLLDYTQTRSTWLHAGIIPCNVHWLRDFSFKILTDNLAQILFIAMETQSVTKSAYLPSHDRIRQ